MSDYIYDPISFCKDFRINQFKLNLNFLWDPILKWFKHLNIKFLANGGLRDYFVP